MTRVQHYGPITAVISDEDKTIEFRERPEAKFYTSSCLDWAKDKLAAEINNGYQTIIRGDT